MKMTLSHSYLKANLKILDTLGFPKSMALECLSIDEAKLNAPMERMCVDRFVACINAAVDFTGRPNIALRMGYKFRVESFGQTGGLYSHCKTLDDVCLLYTSPSPRDKRQSRMPSSA